MQVIIKKLTFLIKKQLKLRLLEVINIAIAITIMGVLVNAKSVKYKFKEKLTFDSIIN